MADSGTAANTEQRLVESFLSLAHINSPPRQEGEIMAFLAPQMEALGCSVVFDKAGDAVDGEVGNLIATLPGNLPGAPAIFLSAHVDTVEPTPGIRTVIENGIIRTDGTTILGADDKAAVAAIIEALRQVTSNNRPHGEIQILFSICEEIGLKGAKAMDLSLVRAPRGFVFDSGQPVGGLVVNAPTHDKILAVIHGRKAHAGNAPENGVSAIQAAALGIAKMKLGRIDTETTCNIGTIRGGEATNIVADRVEVLAEARSRDNLKLQAQVEHMLECFKRGAAEIGAGVDLEVTRHYSTFKLTEQDPVVQVAMRAVRQLGLEPALCAGGGGSDANIFNEKGLPSVVLGLGYRSIHTNQESIAVADLTATSRLAAALIEGTGVTGGAAGAVGAARA